MTNIEFSEKSEHCLLFRIKNLVDENCLSKSQILEIIENLSRIKVYLPYIEKSVLNCTDLNLNEIRQILDTVKKLNLSISSLLWKKSTELIDSKIHSELIGPDDIFKKLNLLYSLERIHNHTV